MGFRFSDHSISFGELTLFALVGGILAKFAKAWDMGMRIIPDLIGQTRVGNFIEIDRMYYRFPNRLESLRRNRRAIQCDQSRNSGNPH